jgi:hypothetical protein
MAKALDIIIGVDPHNASWTAAAVDGEHHVHGMSLSRFLCKSIYGWLGEVVVDAVGVGQGEGAEGLFPALHDRAFDQSGRGSALAGG